MVGWLLDFCDLYGHPLNAGCVCFINLRLIVRRLGFDGATDLLGSAAVRLVSCRFDFGATDRSVLIRRPEWHRRLVLTFLVF